MFRNFWAWKGYLKEGGLAVSLMRILRLWKGLGWTGPGEAGSITGISSCCDFTTFPINRCGEEMVMEGKEEEEEEEEEDRYNQDQNLVNPSIYCVHITYILYCTLFPLCLVRES
jgi:hypothetical protein